MQSVSGMSPAGKATVSAGGGGAVLTAVGFITGAWVYVAYIAGALAIAVLLVLAFRFFLKVRQKGRATPFIGKLLGTTTGSPATADPAMRARLDDLRKRFEEGIEKFKAAGKDVYSLPWVLMAGPSGSGKTEAIRHCNVGFPPGLQDPLQGTGGTLNMNWWFTNHAVILDTAGKMFMEEGGSEWKELMKLLKSWRPMQPVNGMVLAIGVDSLIKDSAEKIEHEAAKVARQLDSITRDLDVRFPVYIIVTKCDLLTGFREFFTTITDPQLQHQMLGWSNPADLDEQFQADRVTEHLEQVCRRLVRRRGALLSDPTPQNMQAVHPRRMDEVDALYALPESLSGIGSRLRRYLELIFVQGEWSAKPLFLRGIYFTSALQEGRELDEAIARAMGVPVDALPGGGTFRNEKSYFLRDLLMAKVFPEKGLVTRATNVKQQQRGRKMALLGSGIGVVVLCLAFTVLGYFSLAGKVQQPAGFWESVNKELETPGAANVVAAGGPGQVVVTKAADSPSLNADWRSPSELLARTTEQSQSEIRVPAIFRALASVIESFSLNDNVKRAHAAVSDVSLVRPLVGAARGRFVATEPSVNWIANDSAAVKVLGSLVQIERAGDGGGKFDSKTSFPVADYLRLTASEEEVRKLGGDADLRALQDAVEQAFGASGIWPPEGLKGRSDIKAVETAAASFNAHWPQRLAADAQIGKLVSLQASLEAFAAADKGLTDLVGKHDPAWPADQAQYDAFKADWVKNYAQLEASWKLIEPMLADVTVKDVGPGIDKAAESINRTVDESYRLVLGMSGAESSLERLATAAGDAASKDAAAKDAIGKIENVVGDPILAALLADAPKELEPALKGMYEAWKALKRPDGAVASALGKLKEFYGPQGRGAALLADAVGGDATIKRAVAARFDVYKQVNDIFNATRGEVAWGAIKSEKVMSLKDAVDGIDADLATRMALIDQRAKMAGEPGTDGAGSIQRTGRFAARVAAMGRRGDVLRSAFSKRTGTDEGWVRTRVAEITGELAAASAADLRQPAPSPDKIALPVPFASQSLQIDRAYDPQAARRLFDDSAVVSALVGLNQPVPSPGQASVAPGIVDPPARTQEAKETIEAVTRYARLYVQQWTTTAIQKMDRVDAGTWREYRSLLNDRVNASSGQIGSSLEQLAVLMLAALQAIPADVAKNLGSGAPIADWTAAIQSDIQNLRSPALMGRRTSDLGRWTALPEGAGAAVTRLGGLDGSLFRADYFDSFSDDFGDATKPTGPGARYFDVVRVSALSKIADDIATERGDILNDLKNLQKLPLSMEPPPAWTGEAANVPAMTVDYLGRVRNALTGLGTAPAAPGAPADGQGLAARKWSSMHAAIRKELERIFGNVNILNDARGPRLVEAWAAWLPQVAPEAGAPLTASVIVMPAADTKDPAPAAEAEKYTNMAGTVTWFSVARGAGAPVERNNNDFGKAIGDAFPVLDSAKVRLTFSDQAGGRGGVSGARELASGWSVLELLADPDARPWGDAVGGKQRWMVPVRFNGTVGGAAGKYYMWMGIELSKPLPEKTAWPGPHMWK
ncbi:MAG: hypothetical protein IT435_01725 [Phycisphaerales bacterium]|nr:hypothetical protein [Phycisphaerales bacterium]